MTRFSPLPSGKDSMKSAPSGLGADEWRNVSGQWVAL
jgi:hypothetical protein